MLALSFRVRLITASRMHGGQFRPGRVNYLQPQSAVSADPLAQIAGIVRPQILIARAAKLIAADADSRRSETPSTAAV